MTVSINTTPLHWCARSKCLGWTYKLCLVLALMLLLPSSLLYAQTQDLAHSTDLLSVYRLALEEDAQLKAMEARYRSALEAKPLARSALLPQLEGGLTQSYSDSNPHNSPGINYHTTRFALNLQQSIYNHAHHIALRQADLDIARMAAELDAARQALILRVAEAYFGVLAAQDNLIFAVAEQQAIERQLEQSQRRFEVGLIAITDVKESQAQFDISVAQKIAAMNQLDIAHEALAVITNRHYEALAVLSQRMPLVSPDPQDIDAWATKATELNLSLAAQRLGVAQLADEIKRQRAGHYPTLGLGASYTDTSFHDVPAARAGALHDSRDAQLALQLQVPLYSGGRTSSLVRQARENFDAAREELSFTERQVIRQTRAAYLSVVSGISSVQALNRALESTQAAAEAAESGFEIGTRTAVDVLMALREVFRAQRDYAQTRYDYLLSTLRLKEAAGMLDESDLRAVNAWLD